MIKQSKIAVLVSALAAGFVLAGTAAATPLVNQPIAREAGEIRGEGKGHPAIEIKDQLARGKEDKSGEGPGHPAIDIKDQQARGKEDKSGEGSGHPAIEIKDQLARHGADDPLDPPEDIGDDHGGRRG